MLNPAQMSLLAFSEFHFCNKLTFDDILICLNAHVGQIRSYV